MRIISQDGLREFEYENFCLSISLDNSIVATKRLAETPEVAVHSSVASYESREKVLKALDLLHTAYMQNKLISTVATGLAIREVQPEQQKHFECFSKQLADSFVWRFPADDEVE